jgi:hypothetical protein
MVQRSRMKPPHREYHFLLHTCNLGSRTKTVVNPFTGEEFQKPIDDGLSKQEIDALRESFAAHKVHGPVNGGHLVGPVYGNEWVSLHTEFELGGASRVVSISVLLEIDELEDEVLEAILTIARNGNLALMSQLGKSVRIIDRQPTAKELARWPDAEKLSSLAELRQWIEVEIQGVRVDA